VDLTLTVGSGVPSCVRGDRVRLMQILLNLVGNAIKFTPSGSVRVAISGPDAEVRLDEAVMPEFRMLCFEVSDTGIGISPPDQSRIFESFTRITAADSEQVAGTGLGLAIAKRLAELHGGDIGVRSTPGVGSTFWFTIRVGRPSARRVATEAHGWQPLVHDPLAGRVLVVEDNAVNREIAVTLLRSLGLEVEAVADGEAAIGKVMGTAYDAVLLDCHMPAKGGIATATRIRELGRGAGSERLAEVPLIAFTTDATEEGRAACLLAGMNDYIIKPFRQADVLRTLTRWLDRTAPRRGAAHETIVDATSLFRARRAS
jgi:CheY-like chemotaxis protein